MLPAICAHATVDVRGVAAVLQVLAAGCNTNPLSGDHVGPDAVVAHLRRFMELSAGTFHLETISVAEAGNLVATTVRFSASRTGKPDLTQFGADVFRVHGDQIAEVWLISEDQAEEDAFWS
jgi:hypothetical protein